MFSVLCAVDCSYFAFAEIFGLRIFVLSDDLELTLLLVFPFLVCGSYSRSGQRSILRGLSPCPRNYYSKVGTRNSQAAEAPPHFQVDG
jgi:hypothetical protein